MLILPEGHWRAVSTPRRYSRRDRWMIGSAAALLIGLAIALVISFGSTAGTSAHGCIDITAAAATGGTELRKCGSEARLLCRSVPPNPGNVSGLTALIPDACRKAGLPLAP